MYECHNGTIVQYKLEDNFAHKYDLGVCFEFEIHKEISSIILMCKHSMFNVLAFLNFWLYDIVIF